MNRAKAKPPSKVMFARLCRENSTSVIVLLPGSCAHLKDPSLVFNEVFMTVMMVLWLSFEDSVNERQLTFQLDYLDDDVCGD